MPAREPGPIAAALESPAASYGLIADGWHVSPALLRLALRGCGHPMLVTDAMPPVGGSKPSFQLYGTEIRVEAGRCLRADGTLAGAALDMASAVRNCVNLLQVSLPEALRFASWNPRISLDLGTCSAGSPRGTGPIWWPSIRRAWPSSGHGWRGRIGVNPWTFGRKSAI